MIFKNTSLSQLNSTYKFQFQGSSGKSVSQVIRRILGLQLVLTRWGIEAAISMQKTNIDRFGEAKENLDRVIYNLTQDIQLKNECFTSKEFDLLKGKPLGSWNDETDIYELDGLWEQFGTLQYVLSLQPKLPEPWKRYNQSHLFQTTKIQPKYIETVDQFLKSQNFAPRSEAELVKAIGTTEVWFWRAQAQSLLNLNKIHQLVLQDDQQLNEIDQFQSTCNHLPKSIALATQRASQLDYLIANKDNSDFLVEVEQNNWKSYNQLDESTLEKLKIIAMHRKHALDFLFTDNELTDVNEPISDLPETPGLN